jgi:hypothetical protein
LLFLMLLRDRFYPDFDQHDFLQIYSSVLYIVTNQKGVCLSPLSLLAITDSSHATSTDHGQSAILPGHGLHCLLLLSVYFDISP